MPDSLLSVKYCYTAVNVVFSISNKWHRIRNKTLQNWKSIAEQTAMFSSSPNQSLQFLPTFFFSYYFLCDSVARFRFFHCRQPFSCVMDWRSTWCSGVCKCLECFCDWWLSVYFYKFGSKESIYSKPLRVCFCFWDKISICTICFMKDSLLF